VTDALDSYDGPYEPDALVRFMLFDTVDGGREHGVGPGAPFYSCPLMVTERRGRDCRILLDGAAVELGKTYEFPVVFLDPEGARSDFVVGVEVGIWEGRRIGNAEIVRFSGKLTEPDSDRPTAKPGEP
jgi:hypothetical protein